MSQFDESRLMELIEVFGPDDLTMVIEAFLDEAGEAVSGLADLLSDGPDPVREAQLHYLVGAARNLGATEFGDLCAKYQRSLDGYNADNHADLRTSFQETCQAFNDRVAEAISRAA